MKLMHAHLGNGLTIWDKDREKNGDYLKVAHINANREITYYVKKPNIELTTYATNLIKINHAISETQIDQFVFINEEE